MKERQQPSRMCVACREMKDKRSLIRVVRSPQGEITLDPGGKAPGRGAYICRSQECWKRAKKARSLEKALKTKLSDQLLDQLAQEIAGEQRP